MRRFLPFMVIAALGILYLWQKRSEPPPAPVENPAVSSSTVPPRQVYEHDWAKHSIDRAREVADQARKRTKDAQNP